MFTRFGIAPLLAALLLSTPLHAHEEHQDDMSDAEMVAMEAGLSMTEEGHREGTMDPSDGEIAAQTMSPDEMMRQKIEENRLSSAEDLLARLHPVAAHFPIALLLVAALAELALMLRPTLGLQTTIRFLVAGGALGALVAAILGWFAGGWRLTDQSDNLSIHRWNGTTLAILGLLAWWAAARGKGRAGLRLLLALIAAGLIVQGYYGGEMVHGPNHMGFM